MTFGKSLATLALLIGIGCSGGAPIEPAHRMGAVAGQEHWGLPAGMTNPATADAGLLAAVGDIYTAADLSHAFVRFGTNNTDWQPFPSVVATTTQAGLMSAATASALQAGLPTMSFVSDEFDFSTPGTYAFSSMSSLPGYTLGQVSARFLLTNIAATTFATGPTLSVGSNVTFDNILTSAVQPAASTINTFLALGNGGTYPGGSLATQSSGKLPDLTVSPSVHVTVGATGTAITQAKARIVLTGFLSKTLPFN